MRSWRFMVNLLCAIGLCVPLLVQPALNQRDTVFAQSDNKEPNPMVTWYAETYGISYAEAERRLLLQAEMSGLEQKVIDGEPSYAGSWMEHAPEFRLVVAFASPDGQTLIQKYLEGIAWADLVHVQQSPYTAVELLHISEQVNEAARATGIPFMSGPSYQRSKIVLYTASPDELRSQLEANESIQAYLGDVEYVYETSMAVPATPPEDQNPIVLWYAKAYNLSYEEAERRLQLQAEMDELEKKVTEGEPLYAGSWMEHEPTFGLVVAFAASNGEDLIKKYLDGIPWADLVRTQERRYTMMELTNILGQVNLAAQETRIPFASGIGFQTKSITVFTVQPEELRSQLEAKDTIRPYMDIIEYVYQESPPVPAELKYPYLLGGHPISTCTTGFVLTRNSDGRRFMMTAGHCNNAQNVQYNGVYSIYLGPTGNANGMFENDPFGNVGNYGDDMDFQTHDASVRSFDLTNVIRTGATATASVVSVELEATTHGDMVCKYGKITAETCGIVTYINHSPGGDYGNSDDYVRVDILINDIACPGDSGAPVYKYVAGGVSGLGVLSGIENALCNGTSNWFLYTPVDEINRAGFSILTSRYQQRYRLMVWSGANCTEYITPIDDNGKFLYGQQTTQACGTSLPTGSSGTVQSYNAYVVGQYWREGMWRGGIGYVRKVPLNNNGTVNWGGAPAWSVCCGGQTAPRAQEGKIVGNHIYLNVFESNGGCTEHKAPINNSGDPDWASETTAPCRTTTPAGGAVQSYNMYVLAENWREGIWQSNLGYTRTVALNNTNTDINYGGAPSWVSCCNGITPPDSQGGDILTYP